MCDEAARNDKLAAITAAMEDGTGLAGFRKKYPDRFLMWNCRRTCSDICGGNSQQVDKAGIRRVFVIFTEGI